MAEQVFGLLLVWEVWHRGQRLLVDGELLFHFFFE